MRRRQATDHVSHVALLTTSPSQYVTLLMLHSTADSKINEEISPEEHISPNYFVKHSIHAKYPITIIALLIRK